MLIQDFKVKQKPKVRVSLYHKDDCSECKRVEFMYKNYPGFRSNIVYYLAKPCQSLLKRARPQRDPEELKAYKEFMEFLKGTGQMNIATATAEKGKLKEKVFVLGRGEVLKK